MTRTCCVALLVAAGAMVGCSNRMGGMDNEGPVRFDQNGNKIYDPSVRNTRSADSYSTSDPSMQRSWDGGNRRDEWNTRAASSNTNWSHAPGTEWRNNAGNASDDAYRHNGAYNQNDSRYTQNDNRAWRNDQNWNQSWNDRDVTWVQESDLPSPVRSTFQRESGNAQMSEIGWVQYDGKKCYCSKVRKDGVTYKMVSDADGNLIAMKRID